MRKKTAKIEVTIDQQIVVLFILMVVVVVVVLIGIFWSLNHFLLQLLFSVPSEAGVFPVSWHWI